jgi:hypothetical protein
MVLSSGMKARVRRIPAIGPAASIALQSVRRHSFTGSRRYWESRYAEGGTSGEGSTGRLAEFKAEVLNGFVRQHDIDSVVEFGCGDGDQLSLAKYPRYLGLDVAGSTVDGIVRRFAADETKSFLLYDPARFTDPAGLVTADLALSLDVIYHLVEDDVYESHLRHVFGAGRRFVVLYTSDADVFRCAHRPPPHVRHRPVVRDVAVRFPRWRLMERIPNRYPYRADEPETSFADFLVYGRISPALASGDSS